MTKRVTKKIMNYNTLGTKISFVLNEKSITFVSPQPDGDDKRDAHQKITLDENFSIVWLVDKDQNLNIF